jgi:NitT/TauT family transport system substrate-binding protein
MSLRFVTLAVAATVAMLSSLATAAFADSTASPIRVAGTLNDSGAEVFYAEEMGFFKKAGLDVKIVKMSSAGVISSAVVSGALDIGQLSVPVVALAHERGIPLVMIAPAGMYTSKAPTNLLLVAKRSTFKTGADLNGKTVAVRDINSIAYVGVKAWIDSTGGDSKTVKFVEIPDGADEAALSEGRVDAATVSQPDLAVALQGNTRVLASFYDAIGKEFLLGCYFTTAAYAKAHPDVIRKFAAALEETARWANANQRRSGQILEAATKQKVLPTTTRMTYPEKLNVSLIQPVITAAARYGLIRREFSAGELIAPEIVNQ